MLESDKRRVLVIDDDVDTCDLYAAALASSGFDVAVLHDGAMGLERLTHDTFDVAVIDIGLGTFGGLDLVRTVTAKLGDRVPYFIAVSGYGGQRDRAAGIEAGFREYHPKPFAPEDVVAAVRRGVTSARGG